MSEKKTNVTTRSKAQSLGLFLNKHSARIAFILTAIMAVTCAVVFAEETLPDAETLWDTLAGLIKTWVTRLGGVVMLIGGIMFGLGWQQDDSARKTAGLTTVIAGAIVIVIAQLTGTFMG